MKVKYVKRGSITSPFIKIDQTWEEYLKTVQKDLRQKINRTRNIYNKIDQYQITQYTVDKTGKVIDDLLAISRKTWKYDAGTAIASSKENIKFYQELAKVFSDKNSLSIWVLEIDSKPAAFDFSLMFNNKTYMLKVGYDKEYSKYAPGVFISLNAVRDSFDKGKSEYDFLGDNDAYKRMWTNIARKHVKYIVFNDSILGNALYRVESNIIPLLKGLRSFIAKKEVLA